MEKLNVGSAIEKIKRQEENKERENKERERKFKAAVAAQERSIRETLAQIDKYKQKHEKLLKKTHELRVHLCIQKTRRDALSAQVAASNKELVELQAKLNEKYSEVQDLRSKYIKEVQDVTDRCDIWAFITKSETTETELSPRDLKKPLDNSDQAMQIENRLKIARERRDKSRDRLARLMARPHGGEFTRQVFDFIN